jgi:YVTN family beta-propeller protein
LLIAASLLTGTALGQEDSAPPGPPAVQHYEYVFPDGGFYVYDMDDSHTLVKQVELPQTARGTRGVAAGPATGMLYISYGDHSPGGRGGSLLKYDLVADRVVWDRTYAHGIDSMAITPDGSTIYMPDGEFSKDRTWYIIDTSSGDEIDTVDGGLGPHNTMIGLSGQHAYLSPRFEYFLWVVDTQTRQAIRAIGPLRETSRPFTINGAETLAFTTATGHIGFQVGDIATGQVLYTVDPQGYSTYDSSTFCCSAPSHGISLSPDEREIYVVDFPHGYVHVFDVSDLPGAAPVQVADIRFQGNYTGKESPCGYDCDKDGWVHHSLDGRYVYVGDSGDVIDTATRTTLTVIPTLSNTRKMLEIDWENGAPSATSSRHGMGYIRGQ